MSEQQPEYVWAFPSDKPKRPRRVWLITGLAIAAMLIAGGVTGLLIRPNAPIAAPSPIASSSPAPTSTASSAASASPTPIAPPASTTPPTEQPTPPPPNPAPDLSAFRAQVAPVLNDAERGLDIARDSDGQQAAQTIGLLQEDAGRLVDVVAPSSITQRWTSGVREYAKTLDALRAAYETSGGVEQASNATRSALDELNGILEGR